MLETLLERFKARNDGYAYLLKSECYGSLMGFVPENCNGFMRTFLVDDEMCFWGD